MMHIAVNALIMDERKAGIGNYAYYLLKAMCKQSFPWKIDVYIQDRMKAYFNDTANIHFISCGSFKNAKQRIRYEQYTLPKFIRQKKYHIVHYLDYLTPVIPIAAKVVVTIHDLSYYHYPEFFTPGSRLIKQALTHVSVSRAHRIICVSDHTREDIRKKFPKVSVNKLKTIHLAAEKQPTDEKSREIFNDTMKKIGINGKYILYVGTLEPRKNVALLIRAYKKAVMEGHIPHQLLLCGKPGWKYEGIYETAAAVNLPERIIFGGYVSDTELPLLYQQAEVFVYPSHYEGFGLPPLEAMQYGTPVIASNVSSLPEVLGDAALFFHPTDENALSEQLLKVIQHEEVRKRLISNGFEQAAKYSWEQTAEATVAIYRELMED